MPRRKPETNADNSAIGIGVGGAGGLAAGAATGAAIGTAIGGPIGTPIGAVIGAVAGGVAGGYAGNEVARAIDPRAEDTYWEQTHRNRPYVEKDISWEQYRPAYRYGVASATKLPAEHSETFEEMESRLRRGWGHAHGKSNLTWNQAREAVRDAYDRAIKLHEERLHVDKETVQTGNVHVRKEVVTEQKSLTVPVQREEVVIERRPVRGGAVKEDLQAEEIRIPVKEEQVRVKKDVVVKEEVNVKKRKIQDTETVHDSVQHEELHVDGNGKTTVREEHN